MNETGFATSHRLVVCIIYNYSDLVGLITFSLNAFLLDKISDKLTYYRESPNYLFKTKKRFYEFSNVAGLRPRPSICNPVLVDLCHAAVLIISDYPDNLFRQNESNTKASGFDKRHTAMRRVTLTCNITLCIYNLDKGGTKYKTSISLKVETRRSLNSNIDITKCIRLINYKTLSYVQHPQTLVKSVYQKWRLFIYAFSLVFAVYN